MAEDLYWDEVLLTHDPENASVEVSFKKIDGEGNLLSSGDEPGTPGGAIEGEDGSQPPVDDEGDFIPPGGGGETPAGGNPVLPEPEANPECGEFGCENLEGPVLENSRGGPYSANFRVFAPANDPIFDASSQLPVGLFQANPVPGARNIGRIATDFTQGALTDFGTAAWSDICWWTSSGTYPVDSSLRAATDLVQVGDSWSECVQDGWRYGSLSPYAQSNTVFVSYEDNWGSMGPPGDVNSDWCTTEFGTGPDVVPLGAGFRVEKDINWSAFMQMDASKRYVGLNMIAATVPFGWDAGVYFGVYGWREILTIQMTVGGELDRQTGEFTPYTYPEANSYGPSVISLTDPLWDEGIVSLQGKLVVFCESGYYGATFEGTATAFGMTFKMDTARVIDRTADIDVFTEGRIGPPFINGNPVIYEHQGTRGDTDYDVPRVLLYNGAGLTANSEDLLAEYAKGSQYYTPPDYCQRIP